MGSPIQFTQYAPPVIQWPKLSNAINFQQDIQET